MGWNSREKLPDAGVVDEPGKAAVADGVADDGHGGRDGLGIGDFDDDQRHLARRLRNKVWPSSSRRTPAKT